MSSIKIGYPGLSGVMAHADGLGMFKQFSVLNMLNLLYMQAELLTLEDELKVMTLNDHRGPAGSIRTLYAKSAKRLRDSSGSADPKEREQWEKVLEIRLKLKEYSTYYLGAVSI